MPGRISVRREEEWIIEVKEEQEAKVNMAVFKAYCIEIVSEAKLVLANKVEETEVVMNMCAVDIFVATMGTIIAIIEVVNLFILQVICLAYFAIISAIAIFTFYLLNSIHLVQKFFAYLLSIFNFCLSLNFAVLLAVYVIGLLKPVHTLYICSGDFSIVKCNCCCRIASANCGY